MQKQAAVELFFLRKQYLIKLILYLRISTRVDFTGENKSSYINFTRFHSLGRILNENLKVNEIFK